MARSKNGATLYRTQPVKDNLNKPLPVENKLNKPLPAKSGPTPISHKHGAGGRPQSHTVAKYDPLKKKM